MKKNVNRFENVPLIKLLIPLLVGILISSFFNNGFVVLFSAFNVAFFVVSSFYFYFKSKSFNYTFLWTTAFIALGYLLAYFYVQYNGVAHFKHFVSTDKKTAIEVKLIESPIAKANSYKAYAEVQQIYTQNKNIKPKGKILLYFEKDSSTEQLFKGDVLRVFTSINETENPKNPNEFSFRNFLKRENIFHQAYVRKKDFALVENRANTMVLTIEKIKKHFQRIINNNVIGEDQIAVASALLLGNKSHLTTDLVAAYASSGATHILAVSGLHVGIFYMILSSLLQFMQRNKWLKWLRLGCILLGIWFYVLLSGASASVVRAALMFSLIAVGAQLNRYQNIYNTIAFSFMLMVLINPLVIEQVGFQLSYIAVAGIIYLQPKIYNLWYIQTKWADTIWKLTSVAVAAQIVTFPLVILYFHQFPAWFWISNLVVIPGAFTILVLGIALFVFSFNTFLLSILAKILSAIIYLLNQVLQFLKHYEVDLLSNVYITPFQALVIYAFIICLVLSLVHRQKKMLWASLGLALFLSGSISLFYIKTQNNKQLMVYFVPKHTAIEIQTGRNSYAYFDSAIYKHKQIFNFRIKHNQLAHKIQNKYTFEDVEKVKIQNMEIYSILKKKIALVQAETKLPSHSLKVNYVVLSKNFPQKIEQLSYKIKAEKYIFDTSNSLWKQKQWKQDCEKLGLDCYFVNDGFAFIQKI